MNAVTNTIRKQFLDRLRVSQTTGPMLLAVAIGMSTGLTAVALRVLIQLMELFFQDFLGAFFRMGAGNAWTIPVIASGGLLVGLLSRYLAPETRGHGIPEVILAVTRYGGRMRARVAVVKLVAAAITIGSGGSAGRKGPIVHIGSVLGSMMAQWLRLSDRMVILSVACGAAGGIAATFNAPMAGVIFSLEVIVRRFTAQYFGLVVISAAAATMTMRWMSGAGDYPQFTLLHEHSLISALDLFFFLALGALCALAAHAFVLSLSAVEKVSKKSPLPMAIRPAVGGALVGCIAISAPQIMGSGYESIEAALNDNILGWTMLWLCVAKVVGTALTVGSGGSGGVFMPSLFIGAMLGGAYGTFLNSHWPALVSTPGAYAMVGMSVVFAAAAHAPITGILVIIEMTDNYYIIVPLMSATVVGTFISQSISKNSIYTIKLMKRGIHITDTPDVNLMDAVTVAEAMDTDVDSVPPEMPVTELIEKMRASRENGFLVLDEQQKLLGIVTAHDVEDAVTRRQSHELRVQDIYTRHVVVCRPEQTLSVALSQFGAHSFGRLPVIDPHQPGCVVGVLRRQSVISACVNAQQRSDEMLARAEQYQVLRQRAAMVIETAAVTTHSALANLHVRDAVFPPEATLGAIRRGYDTIVPRGSTLIQPGDELVVLTTQDHHDAVREWLRTRTR